MNLKDTALSIFMKSASQMSVNYEEMSMNSPSSVQFLLRRCSTPSYVQEPNNKSSTQWVWYWKDNNGWKKYAETIQSSGAKQEKIEAAYLNDERTYSFGSGSHNYILKFCETPMYQMNTDPDLLTKRQVRRRPLFASKSEPQDTSRQVAADCYSLICNPKGRDLACSIDIKQPLICCRLNCNRQEGLGSVKF